MPPRKRTATVPIDQIGQSILILRGQRVLLDSDLAALYGVTTKRLNEQVKRNIDRFPEDFMFSLRAPEWDALRSQIATSKVATGFSDLKSQNATANTPRSERGGRRSLPNAFTEHGAIQAANVNSACSNAITPTYTPHCARKSDADRRSRCGPTRNRKGPAAIVSDSSATHPRTRRVRAANALTPV
jgi:hypothetical protein